MNGWLHHHKTTIKCCGTKQDTLCCHCLGWCQLASPAAMANHQRQQPHPQQHSQQACSKQLKTFCLLVIHINSQHQLQCQVLREPAERIASQLPWFSVLGRKSSESNVLCTISGSFFRQTEGAFHPSLGGVNGWLHHHKTATKRLDTKQNTLCHHCPGFMCLLGKAMSQLSHMQSQVLFSSRSHDPSIHHQDGEWMASLPPNNHQMPNSSNSWRAQQSKLACGPVSPRVLSVGKPGSNVKLPKTTTTFTTASAFATSLLRAAQNTLSPSHSHQLSAPAPAPSAETLSKTHCITTALVFCAWQEKQ